MSLEKYKQKRSFNKTPEPEGGKPDKEVLRFVIQKHAASRLHYDFRLEMDGVLKSWAVPKGPSTDPSVKRLAMMVEDHPYDYRNFEGIIPKGQYGGGTVIVWDEGTYAAVEADGTDKRSQEKSLLQQLETGKIKIVLKGKKLKGEYALVRAKGRGDNGWLLMKLDDKYATEDDITLKDKSVRSRKTVEQVAETSTTIYGKEKKAEKKAGSTKTSAKSKAAQKAGEGDEVQELIKKAPKGKFPSAYRPMLATLVDKPFDDENWVYEVKWDGYRALALMNKGEVELKSRNDKSFNDKFYPIVAALGAWGKDMIIDGEVVVLNERGISDFGALQNWRSEADGELMFYVFDILWLQGKDLTSLSLVQRRQILRDILPEDESIRISETFEASGTEFFELAKQMGLEGIIAKKADSTYEQGARTKNWLKIKAAKRQEVVIGGFTKNENTNKQFSSLLVGVFEKGEFVYTGKIGTGFTDKMQREMMAQFQPLVTDKSPFTTTPDVNKPSRFRPNPPKATATWLKPELVCEVSYAEMTSDGVMRHPSFEGMRIDKKPEDVGRETATPTKDVTTRESKLSAKKMIAPSTNTKRKTLLNPTEASQEKTINGNKIKFTNLGKVFWPDVNVTKRDMLNYYYLVAPYMLPYLKDRPMSLNRHPNGINGKSFYQKDVTGKVPSWVKTYLYHTSDTDKDKHYMVGDDDASLVYMASLGCIEMNPWSSTIQNPDNPDWCIIDLDPDKNHFDQVIEAAQVTRQVLESIGAPCYCKTSGSTGLHIYIPLGGKYSYEDSKEFARAVATTVHKEIPSYTSIERLTSKRGGKMYIDFLQNRPKATLAAPYSLRPKPGAPVSMPLQWDEVKKGMKITDFNIFNAMERISSSSDIFKPVLGKGIDLAKVLKKLSGLP